MAEYIGKEALLAELERREKLMIGDKTVGIDAIKRFIENRLAADVAPVVHDRWIWHEDSFEYECSACNCRFDYNHTFGLFDHGYQYANYCPNCGAQMDGE